MPDPDREPRGTVISCRAAYGQGGLGQHFAEFVEAVRREGDLQCYFTNAPPPDVDACSKSVRWAPPRPILHTVLRWHPGMRNHFINELFDKQVARTLRAPLRRFVGFGGQALRSFRRARALGAERLELIAANSHVENVRQCHAWAYRLYPYESSWLNNAQVQKTLMEYELADRIYVASEYTRESFLTRGFPTRLLEKFELHPNARFQPSKQSDPSTQFRIAYVGSLTVAKGIPILIDAFSSLQSPRAELVLVGGSSSRGMRRYLRNAQQADPRIRLVSGDPLPYLQRATVYVHPTFEDGFGYAVAEAAACGLPVIVTEDTGAKEQIRNPHDGLVIPTGDTGALARALHAHAV